LLKLFIPLSKKLHILFLSGWYPSRVLPSNGDFVQRHAEAVATKHKVTLIHVITDEILLELERTVTLKNNVKTIILYLPKVNNSFAKFYFFIKSYISEISKIDYFDMVHLNITYPLGMLALYMKFLKNKPYIISEHWSDYQKNLNKSIGFFQKFITKIIIRNASFICPVTTHLKDAMINFGLKGNYYPIPNVVNTSIFNKLEEKDANEFVISHISGMQQEIKNVKGIINVISKLQNKIPNLKFNLIGNNSSKYIDYIKKLAINNSTIKEQIPNDEIANYLNKTDVFVLFSNYENLPCVIIESFACGVPVVSTNVGGISEYFPKNFGYLIEPKDEIALEKSILNIRNKKLIPNKDEMVKFADYNFGISTICNSFTELYLKSLNK